MIVNHSFPNVSQVQNDCFMYHVIYVSHQRSTALVVTKFISSACAQHTELLATLANAQSGKHKVGDDLNNSGVLP